MQQPSIVLDMLNKRSQNNHPIDKIYHYLFNPEWYRIAYRELYSYKDIDNKVDRNIIKIIEDIRLQKYNWNRTVNLTFKDNDILVREVLRMILSAIYEPKFSNLSFGFNRPNRGINIALTQLVQKSRGSEFFIYNSINVESVNQIVLIKFIQEDIKDGRFIELIRKMLKNISLKDNFIYNQTYSKTPISDKLNSLLMNIYLSKIDKYVEQSLIPNWNIDNLRKTDKAYNRKKSEIERLRRKINILTNKQDRYSLIKKMKQLIKELRKLPSKERSSLGTYRRLSYVRYANSYILSFIGTYNEAVQLKQQIANILQNQLQLVNYTADNTIISKSTDKRNPARFLEHNVLIDRCNNKITTRTDGRKVRAINGDVVLFIPNDILHLRIHKFLQNGKPIHINSLINSPIYNIIQKFQSEYKNIVQYYKFTRNIHILNYLKYVMEVSMMKTIAGKQKLSCSKLYKKISSRKQEYGYIYKILEYSIIVKNEIKTAYFGAVPLRKTIPNIKDYIDDNIKIYIKRS